MKTKAGWFIVFALMIMMVVLQACGGNGGNGGNSGSIGGDGSGGAAANGGPSSAQPAVPAVLNYGFVGSKEPSGVEGWGFHTGLIQEELKKYGVAEVNVIPFLTGPDLNESIIGGRVDVGSSGDTPAILARASGAKTRLLNFSNAEVNTLLIGRKDGVQHAKELKGKTVATVKGSLMYRFLVDYLEGKGLANDIDIININSIPDQEAALLRGEIEAYAVPSYYPSSFKLLQDGHPILAQAKEQSSLLSVSVVYATEGYLEQFPEFQQVWTGILDKVREDLHAKPDAYYEWLSGNTGTPVDILKQIQPIENLPTEALSDQGIERLKASKDFLIKQKLAKNDFSVDEWILK